LLSGLEALEHLAALSGSLTSLDCSGNALRCVRGVAALPRLREADLRHNALATLADATAPLRQLATLRQLSLAGNPLCGAFASADAYRAAVAAALPQLTHLDGAPLPARAGGHEDEDGQEGEAHAWEEEEEEQEEQEEERKTQGVQRSARPLRVRWREDGGASAPAPQELQQQDLEQEQQALRAELAAARRAAADAVARADAADAAAAAARRAAEAAEAARAEAAVAAARSDAATQARSVRTCRLLTMHACFCGVCLTRLPCPSARFLPSARRGARGRRGGFPRRRARRCRRECRCR
jgi:hypothetical protein